MKKGLLNLAIALTLVVVGVSSAKIYASAETIDRGWTVTYGGKSEVDFSSTYATDYTKITGAMPGDTIQYTITYKNEADEASLFYMNANVVKSLEDGKKDNGGAYGYTIKNNGTEIFNSDTVGGDAGSNKNDIGLAQVCGEEGTYFSLGKIPVGGSGKVTVSITLDGDSQLNQYGAKAADLNFFFKAETESQHEINKVVEKEVIKNDFRTKEVNESETRSIVKQIVKKLDNGTTLVQIDDTDTPLGITIDDDNVPLAGVKTGDSILPSAVCAVMFIAGMCLIVWAAAIAVKNKKNKEVA